MRKRVLALALIFALLLSMSVFAAEPKVKTYYPRRIFSGTTANCSVIVSEAGADIDVTLTFYRGWSVIDSWSGSGIGYVKVSGSCGR